MSEPIDDHACPTFSSVELKVYDLPFGRIEARPTSDRPLSLESIAADQSSFAGPVYLDRMGAKACAYPIQMDDLSSASFSFRSRFLPPYFGAPIALQVGPKHSLHSGLIYDRDNDRFFKQDVSGLNWYLMGDSENYFSFLEGTRQFSDRLYRIWKESPDSVFSWIPWNLEGDWQGSTPKPETADREIGKFMAWLMDSDPVLYGKMMRRVGYAEKLRQNDPASCNDFQNMVSYAYYDMELNLVFLLPPAIALLEEGKYSEVTQILAHEGAHQKTARQGLVVPSHEMMSHSLDLFLSRISEEGLLGKMRVWLLGDRMRREGMCRLLPLLPEEELQALGEEWDYARDRSITPSSYLSEEAALLSWDIYNTLHSHFPSDWVNLSLQYLRGASDLFDW